jgi:uncharacterized cofD-like protein
MSGAHVPGGPGRADGPRVVAVGGGHGLAATLRAVRGYAGAVTAVVSVADDGGSTGRLRAAGDRPAPGDLRKCLVALAGGDSPLLRAMEYRFDAGELDGHAFGNLLIAALEDSEGDLVSALDEVGRILGAVGRVLPATTHPVQLRAVVGSGAEVRGQVAVARQPDLELVTVDPPDAPVCAPALEAILAADQVVLGPGSLYTSVLAATAVPGIAEGLAATSARLVYVCNLRPQASETAGYGVAEHLEALDRHGIRPSVVVYDPSTIGEPDRTVGVELCPAVLCEPGGGAHRAEWLGPVLAGLAGAADWRAP